MKKSIMLIWGLCLATVASAQAQSQRETINRSASFSNAAARVLSVENIHGFVHIEGYNGNKVELTAEKKITAKSTALVEKGMKEVEVKLVQSNDSIYVYLEAPFIFRKQPRSRNMMVNLEEKEYDYQVDLTLRVPNNVSLIASTVNQGEVQVNNVSGDIRARHVNGPISLTGVMGKTDATTVNGRIDVFYKQSPPADSRFKTVNGNINVYYAPNMNANVAFKTMHGQFYTDLSEVEMMPVKVVKNSDKQGEGTVYKIDKANTYKIGKGGPALSFETLNGNIYLKKNYF